MSKLGLFVSLTLVTFSVMTHSESTMTTTTTKTTPEPKETRDGDEVDYVSIMNECNETFRIEMSYIESLNKSGSFPDENDKTPKCFLRCMLEKYKVISEDGIFYPERALTFFTMQRPTTSLDDIREATSVCSNRNESCICESSYQFLKCVVEMEINH